MAATKEHGLPADRVNAHGGARAMGHPIGSSGALPLPHRSAYCPGMSGAAFNALAAAREPEAAVTHRAAAADREIQATKADIAGLDARIAGLEARICRALWIQGAGIVAIVGGFIAIAAALRPAGLITAVDTPSWERRRLAGIYVLARFARAGETPALPGAAVTGSPHRSRPK